MSITKFIKKISQNYSYWKSGAKYFEDGRKSVGFEQIYISCAKVGAVSAIIEDYHVTILVGSTITRFLIDNLQLSITSTKSDYINNLDNMELKEFKKLFKKCEGITVEVSNYRQIIDSIAQRIVMNTGSSFNARTHTIDNFPIKFRKYVSEESHLNDAIKEVLIKKEKQKLLQSVSVNSVANSSANPNEVIKNKI